MATNLFVCLLCGINCMIISYPPTHSSGHSRNTPIFRITKYHSSYSIINYNLLQMLKLIYSVY